MLATADLLDTSLIPTLIPILTSYLPDIWRQGQDPALQLKILTAFIRPSNLGSETRHRHQLILELLSPFLLDALHKAPKALDTGQLIGAIQPLLTDGPCSYTSMAHLRQRCSTPDGGSIKYLSLIFQSLLNWAYDPSSFSKCPVYSSKDLIVTSLLSGSTRVTKLLVDEILNTALQLNSSLSAIAMELAHAMLCSPIPESFTRGKMNLRMALENDFHLYFGREGGPEIDTITYLAGGRESIIDDLYRAVERTHAPLPPEQEQDLDAQEHLLRAQDRAFPSIEDGLGLSGVATDLDMTFDPHSMTSTDTLPTSVQLIDSNLNLDNLPLDLSFTMTGSGSATSQHAGANAELQPQNDRDAMQIDQNVDYLDTNTSGNTFAAASLEGAEQPPDPIFELAQLQALGNDLNFETNGWNDFTDFDDTTLTQLGEAQPTINGQLSDQDLGTTLNGADMNPAELDGMDLSFLTEEPPTNGLDTSDPTPNTSVNPQQTQPSQVSPSSPVQSQPVVEQSSLRDESRPEYLPRGA